MYFKGLLTIDPSQITKIERKKPEKFFKKLLYHLTAGKVSEKLERETFSAISILEQLNNVLRSMKIDNIIRLSQDDIDFYLDTEGKENDLQDAIDAYDLNTNESYAMYFNSLHLVLEHVEGSFNYLFEIRINRTHTVGEFPIELKINALLTEFRANGQNKETVRQKMKDIFKTQDDYETFMRIKTAEFESFIDRMELEIKKFIPIDDIRSKHNSQIVIPKEKINNPDQIKANQKAQQPAMHGYYGMSDFLFYSFLWSSMCHTNHIHIQDTELVSDNGDFIGDVGNEGLDTSDTSLFDENTPYEESVSEFESEVPETDNFDSDFSNDMDSDLGGDISDDGGSWFDFGGSDSFDGFDGFD